MSITVPRDIAQTSTGRPRGRDGLVVASITVSCGLALAAVYLVGVRTTAGQRLDTRAFEHLRASQSTGGMVAEVLGDITVGTTAVLLAIFVAIALVRRRASLAFGAVLVVGTSIGVAELLKHSWFSRPDLGFGTLNSLPSGHTAIVAAMAFAALLVVPGRVRWLVCLAGWAVVAMTGASTVIAGWHRPSDVVAGLLTALGCSSAVLVLLSPWLGGERRTPAAGPVAASTIAAICFGAVCAALLAAEHGGAPGAIVLLLISTASALACGCYAWAVRLSTS